MQRSIQTNSSVKKYDYIVDVINSIKNHSAEIAPHIQRDLKLKFKTMAGVSKYYKFEFEGIGKVNAFKKSSN